MENFEYLKTKLTNTTCKTVGNVDLVEYKNFFNAEHLALLQKAAKHDELISWDSPITGEFPSTIPMKKFYPDPFFVEFEKFWDSLVIKNIIFSSLGVELSSKILDKIDTDISIHVNKAHQEDDAHTDQKEDMLCLTLQIYIPKDNSKKEYGTCFYNNELKEVYRTEFLPGAGYAFIANTHSWHSGTNGVDRESLLVRYTLPFETKKDFLILNHNESNNTCYVVWNKDLDVAECFTNYLLHITLLNAMDLGIENIIVSKNPKNLKHDFKDQIVVLGGTTWRDKTCINSNEQSGKFYYCLNLKEEAQFWDFIRYGKEFSKDIEYLKTYIGRTDTLAELAKGIKL